MYMATHDLLIYSVMPQFLGRSLKMYCKAGFTLVRMCVLVHVESLKREQGLRPSDYSQHAPAQFLLIRVGQQRARKQDANAGCGN